MSLKKEKSDEFYCEAVAKSISEIIRFSLDEEFRKSSFELFGVSSTKETEKEISKRLMSIIANTSTRGKDKPRKKRKKSNEEKDKENLEEENVKNTNQSSSTNSDSPNINSKILSKNFLQKNWLQISSEQYKNAVKRRKLHYFSQPHFSQAYETDIESSTCDLHFSYSQPTSLMFNETVESFYKESPILDNSADFCQKMFNATFKDNAKKYLKKNSKFNKDFSF